MSKTTEAGIATGAPDLDKLEALARAAKCLSGHWYSGFQIADGITEENDSNLIEACKPQVVLALIEFARRAQPAGAGKLADERAQSLPEKTSERLRLIANSGDKALIDAVVIGEISIKDASEKLLKRAALTHPSVSASQTDERSKTDQAKAEHVAWLKKEFTQQPSAAPSVQQAGAQAQAQPDERAAFEAWHRKEYDSERQLERYNVHDPEDQRSYMCRHTTDMWEGWRARAALSASPSAPAVQAEPTDEQIIAALHSCGIDTRPSKYGFPEVQVDGMNVPNLRRVFAKLYTGAAPAGQAKAVVRPLNDPKMAEYLRGQPWISAYIETLECELRKARVTTTASVGGEPVAWFDPVGGTFYPTRASAEKYATRPDKIEPLYRAPAPSRSAAPAEPKAATPDEVKQAVRDAVTEALTGLYYCGRVWSAWNVGTMSQDDFSPANEDDDIIENVTDAAMNAMTLAAVSLAAPAGGEDARDAARYRWLRSEMCFDKPVGQPVTMTLRAPIPTIHHDVHKDWISGRFDASVDKTVDAALSTMQQSTEGGAA